MLVPVMVDTKLREGLMLSRFFVREQSTRIIFTRHIPTGYLDAREIFYKTSGKWPPY